MKCRDYLKLQQLLIDLQGREQLANLHDPPKLNLNPNKALGDCTPRLREGKESQSGQGYRLWALTTGSNLCKPPHIKRLYHPC